MMPAEKNNREEEEEEEEEAEAEAEAEAEDAMRGLDPSKVAVGALTMFCVGGSFAFAMLGLPDAAVAREVTLDLPDLPDGFLDFNLDDFKVPTSPMEARMGSRRPFTHTHTLIWSSVHTILARLVIRPFKHSRLHTFTHHVLNPL